MWLELFCARKGRAGFPGSPLMVSFLACPGKYRSAEMKVSEIVVMSPVLRCYGMFPLLRMESYLAGYRFSCFRLYFQIVHIVTVQFVCR